MKGGKEGRKKRKKIAQLSIGSLVAPLGQNQSLFINFMANMKQKSEESVWAPGMSIGSHVMERGRRLLSQVSLCNC